MAFPPDSAATHSDNNPTISEVVTTIDRVLLRIMERETIILTLNISKISAMVVNFSYIILFIW